MFNIKNYKADNIKNDILSGLVVAVALVPEAIAFSFIVGINPIVGLYTAFILGLITSLFGGKPGMVSGATGSVAVVLVGLAIEATKLLKQQGLNGDTLAIGVLEYIFLAAILAGILQMIFGVLKLGKFIRLVPLPAIYGFVNGLAIVIAMAQFKFFAGEGWQMYLIVASSMAIMFVLPKFTKAVPAGLVAIVLLTVVAYYTNLNTNTIGNLAPTLANFKGQLPKLHIPDTIFSLNAVILVLPYAIIAALVGLIESLLTLAVLDEISGTRGSGNKESFALGLGNFTCGLFGGMPGCAMIGQSIINYTSGGLGRLSSFTAAVGLMVLVAFLTDTLQLIPIGVLVGIMFMVSIGTFEWSSFGHLKKMPKEDAFIMVAVTVITIFFDLAVAVIIGSILSALVFAWKHAKIYAKVELSSNTKIYKLDGPLFFASVQSFMDIFNIANDPQNVIIDFKDARVLDSSGVEAIENIYKKYKNENKQITIQHLSKDCVTILKQAKSSVITQSDDPEYKVVRDF